MPTLYPCLWFDGKAEEAAEFYTGLFPDSPIDKVWRSPADTPSGPAGMVLTVEFDGLVGKGLAGVLTAGGSTLLVDLGRVRSSQSSDGEAISTPWCRAVGPPRRRPTRPRLSSGYRASAPPPPPPPPPHPASISTRAASDGAIRLVTGLDRSTNPHSAVGADGVAKRYGLIARPRNAWLR